MVTLTHHKKSVRALAIHPTEYTFASASAGGNNIKKWKCPEGTFVFNFAGHNAIINTLSVNAEGVFFSGGDNGSLTLWDWNTGTAFQNMDDIPQPGSLEAEAGVFCSTFDMTGTRLITGGADKTIKVNLRVLNVVRRAYVSCFRSTQSNPASSVHVVCTSTHIRYTYSFSPRVYGELRDISSVIADFPLAILVKLVSEQRVLLGTFLPRLRLLVWYGYTSATDAILLLKYTSPNFLARINRLFVGLTGLVA